MGRFVNPDNSAFEAAVSAKIYVDKTGLISYTNRVINTIDAYICNSRPRRFGKSITADMLTAYYSRGCDSKELFSGYAICEEPSFEKNLNKYDVIHFDVQWCIIDAGGADSVVSYINNGILNELRDEYGDVIPHDVQTAYGAMSYIREATGNRFVVIIDEWDALIRDEAFDIKAQEQYINFLRGMFKGTEPSRYIALAFLTGILPVKKLKTQSALNNFDEFTMLSAAQLSEYIGFTDEDVRGLCSHYDVDYEKVKQWYDGYVLGDYQVYNPKAVVSVLTRRDFVSYWSQTGSYDAIVPLINMDFDGLKGAIIEMISGAQVKVDVTTFQNDIVSFAGRDDVITYLIHLGYLGYNSLTQTAFVPNEELRQELVRATRQKKWDEFINFQNESHALLESTLDMDEQAVAAGIERIHTEYASTIEYNNENSLSSVLTIAYLSSMQFYFKPIRELPTGRGFADFVYIPKPEYRSDYPALIIELKWNRKAQTAMDQIRERKYPLSVLPYTGDILLVEISYDKTGKEHSCLIEQKEKKPNHLELVHCCRCEGGMRYVFRASIDDYIFFCISNIL